MDRKGRMFLAMAIFGTTGFFMRYLTMPASTVAFICSLLGAVILFAAMKITKRKLHWRHLKKRVPILVLSGAALGGSWLLLMQTHHYASDGLSKIVYYALPLTFIMLSSRIGEKVRRKKLVWALVALVGIALTTKIWESGPAFDLGLLFAVGAAVLYGVVVFCNKMVYDISSFSKAAVQLGAAALVMLPYCLLTGGFAIGSVGSRGVVAIIVLSTVHMAFAYKLYFEGVVKMTLQSVVVFNYVNPAVAIFISAYVLKLNMGLPEIAGTALILAGTMASELIGEKIGGLFKKKG